MRKNNDRGLIRTYSPIPTSVEFIKSSCIFHSFELALDSFSSQGMLKSMHKFPTTAAHISQAQYDVHVLPHYSFVGWGFWSFRRLWSSACVGPNSNCFKHVLAEGRRNHWKLATWLRLWMLYFGVWGCFSNRRFLPANLASVITSTSFMFSTAGRR